VDKEMDKEEEQSAFPVVAAAYAALADQRKAVAIVDQVPVDALNVGGLAYLRSENRRLRWQ
jgi:hypothetical protein